MILGQTNKKRPHVNLPLKGDTNDKSLNKYTTSNVSMTSTTGIFGESNGAYLGNGTSSYIDIGGTTGYDNVRALWRTKCTIIANLQDNSNTEGDFHDGFLYGMDTVSTDASLYGVGLFTGTGTNYDIIFSGNGGTVLSAYKDSVNNNTHVLNKWFNIVITVLDNGSIATGQFYFDGIKQTMTDNTTSQRVSVLSNSSRRLYLGGRVGSFTNRFWNGKISGFKIYGEILSDGYIKIINIQKGRIKA